MSDNLQNKKIIVDKNITITDNFSNVDKDLINSLLVNGIDLLFIFLSIFIGVLGYRLKNNSDKLISLFGNYSDKLNRKLSNEEQLLIKSTLKDILDNTNADKVFIIEFHNGTKLYNQVSFEKFSVTYEVSNTKEELGYILKDIPISYLSKELKQLKNEDINFICTKDSSSAIFLKLAKEIYIYKINNTEVEHGLICVQYNKNNFNPELNVLNNLDNLKDYIPVNNVNNINSKDIQSYINIIKYIMIKS